MVAAVRFYADADDVAAMLEFLGHEQQVSLHPWPLVQDPPTQYTPAEAIAATHVMVRSSQFGDPVILRDGDPAFSSPTRAGLFNRLNRERLRPSPRRGHLLDSNRSPVLLWQPGEVTAEQLRTSSIGSQADSMRAVSSEYERWVNRVTGWVRRRGAAVWGLERTAVQPDLDIDLPFLNAVYALPGALRRLESGAAGR